jgi:hypothetical protein
LLLKQVKGRELILFHPASDAMKELKAVVSVSILPPEAL